jgi:uncharacterized protein (TIGR02594 family)
MLGNSAHANHSALTTFLKNGGVNLDPAKKAWCAAFVNSAIAQAGGQGSGSNMARSLLNVGTPTQTPQVGDLAVFSRGDPKGPYGHVGFYKGTDANGNPIIVGGNQGGAVSETSYPKERLLGYRTLGNTINTNPVVGTQGPVQEAGAPTTTPTDPRLAAMTSGLDDIAKSIGGRPVPPPQVEQPQQAQGAPIDTGQQQAAAALMAQLLQTKRMNYGTTLTGGLG